jgi:hypothetical protein
MTTFWAPSPSDVWKRKTKLSASCFLRKLGRRRRHFGGRGGNGDFLGGPAVAARLA